MAMGEPIGTLIHQRTTYEAVNNQHQQQEQVRFKA